MEDRFVALKTCRDLSDLNGLAFEEYLRQLFADLGYKVDKTPPSGDFGADLILEKDGQRTAVQAKQRKSRVGYDALKEVHAARSYYRTDAAWVVATNGFTPQAKKAAKELKVELVTGERLEAMIAEAHARTGKTWAAAGPEPLANAGMFAPGFATGRPADQPVTFAFPATQAPTVGAKTRPARVRMRALTMWERIQRAIDYSFYLPDCWLNNLNRIERSRRFLLAVASILLTAPKGSMTADAVRCQLPATVDANELDYVLRNVPLFKTFEPNALSPDALDRFGIDRELIMRSYDASYGHLDISMALLIDAIEGLPGKTLTVAGGQKVIPAGYSKANLLRDDVLQSAVLLQYVARYEYPDRVVYVPSTRKAQLFQTGGGAPRALEPEEAKKQAYADFALVETQYAAFPAWDVACQYHARVAQLFERYCSAEQGLLGLCYRALFESGGGLTDAEVGEFAAGIQGLPPTMESIGFLRENCLEMDGLIAKMPAAFGTPEVDRYYLAFQVGIDGQFLEDSVAKSQMLQGQIASMGASMGSLDGTSAVLAGLLQQRADVANALQTKAYFDRKDKKRMKQELNQLDAQIAQAQQADAVMKQQAFADMGANVAFKQQELEQVVPRCEAEKWRFRVD